MACCVAGCLAIVIFALSVYRHDSIVGRYIQGCDSFGYSSMAVAIRQGRKTRQPTDFFLHDAQTRWLIAKFKENNVQPAEWKYVVAPHAYHYFPGTDQVAPQYPPGTGWVLSFFPRRSELKSLDRTTIVFVTFAGLLLVGWCAWRGLTASSLVMAGAVGACLSPFSWVDMASYSINASVLPLFLGTVLAWLATRPASWRIRLPLGLVSGLCFGIAVQVRLPSVLLLPGIALLFLPRRPGVLAVFALGTILSGALPVLLHDHMVTGDYLGSTYDSPDQAQRFDCIPANFIFYFVTHARESVLLYVYGLIVATALWLAVAGPLRAPESPRRLRGRVNLFAALLCTGALSLGYFLTHVVVEPYYLIPPMLVASLLLGFFFMELETHWLETAASPDMVRAVRTLIASAAVAVVMVGLGFGYGVVYDMASELSPPHELPAPFTAPPEILAPNAWVWADRYSSSVVYYANHPAFRLYWIGPAWRKRLLEWIRAKGDPQYMVIDGPEMETTAAEARASGWQLIPVGTVRDVPCVRLEMP